MTTGYENPFHEDPSKSLPYSISFQAGLNRTSYFNNSVFRVPLKELLLLYKLKALRDRTHDVKKETNMQRRNYLASKRSKDISDCLALLDPAYGAVNTVTLLQLIRQHQLEFIVDTISALQHEQEAAQQYRNKRTGDIRLWISRTVTDLQ